MKENITILERGTSKELLSLSPKKSEEKYAKDDSAPFSRQRKEKQYGDERIFPLHQREEESEIVRKKNHKKDDDDAKHGRVR